MELLALVKCGTARTPFAGQGPKRVRGHGANREIGGSGFAMSWRGRAWRAINN